MDWKEELIYKIGAMELQTNSDFENFERTHNLTHEEVTKYIATYASIGTLCEGCYYSDRRLEKVPCRLCSRSMQDCYISEEEAEYRVQSK